jgi:predicted acylesterase/phospholipase RssA
MTGFSDSPSRFPTAITPPNAVRQVADAASRERELSITDQASPNRTAFVFAGGGSFGAIQVGMLQSLAAHGISADMVVGSSVGALKGPL